MEGSDLTGADLEGADLSHARVIDAKLAGADLHKTDLRGANLRGADLHGATLAQANLEGATLIADQLAEALSTAGAVLPDGNPTPASFLSAAAELQRGGNVSSILGQLWREISVEQLCPFWLFHCLPYCGKLLGSVKGSLRFASGNP